MNDSCLVDKQTLIRDPVVPRLSAVIGVFMKAVAQLGNEVLF